MSAFDDFAVGDQIHHHTMGNGRVTACEDGFVFVDFDSWKTNGKYDRQWFEIYPNLMIVVTR